MNKTKIQIKTVQLNDGKWAMACGARKHYPSTKSETKKDATISGLKLMAQLYQSKMDRIHSQLESLGAIDPEDTHGYLA